MTSITLNVTGAKIRAAVNGPLTSGMVGIPVTIRCDDVWEGLTRNLVCRCGKWGPDNGQTRTVLNIGETATVAHEVMKADMHLYLGIEGYSADGKLVIPTTWADCGKIQHGANAGADPSADPKLSVWAQVLAEIEKIKQNPVLEADIAAAVAAYLENNFNGIPGFSQNAGLTAEQISALDGMFRVCAFIQDDISAAYAAFRIAFGLTESGDAHIHSYTSSVTTAATCTNAGVRTYTCSCGDSFTEEIPAAGHSYTDGVCTVCGEADPDDSPDVTLTGISAAYSGGSVIAGTAVSDLTGIVVTAHYSDDTSKTVTGYTLSGTIAEGENTITVSYGGLTATFIVTGTAPVTYTITNNLTAVETSNQTQSVTEGESYTATLTAQDGYILHTVTVTMGGEDVTDDVYASSVVNIASVTGDVVITAEGVDASNTVEVVSGWLSANSTATSAPETNESFPNAWCLSNAIAVNAGDTVTVTIEPVYTVGAAMVNATGNVRIRAYDADGSYVASSTNLNGASYNVYTATVSGYVRAANTNEETCNLVSVDIEGSDGVTTYIAIDRR